MNKAGSLQVSDVPVGPAGPAVEVAGPPEVDWGPALVEAAGEESELPGDVVPAPAPSVDSPVKD